MWIITLCQYEPVTSAMSVECCFSSLMDRGYFAPRFTQPSIPRGLLLYTVAQKKSRPLLFYDNLGKRRPIFIIFFTVKFIKDLQSKLEIKLPPRDNKSGYFFETWRTCWHFPLTTATTTVWWPHFPRATWVVWYRKSSDTVLLEHGVSDYSQRLYHKLHTPPPSHTRAQHTDLICRPNIVLSFLTQCVKPGELCTCCRS